LEKPFDRVARWAIVFCLRSFLLRYDDAPRIPLINMPISYGYYYKP